MRRVKRGKKSKKKAVQAAMDPLIITRYTATDRPYVLLYSQFAYHYYIHIPIGRSSSSSSLSNCPEGLSVSWCHGMVTR